MEDAQSSAIATKLGLGKGFDFRVACWPVYLLVCGLAVELLLKTILVAQGRKPDGHKLAELWGEAGLSATPTQHGLLEILTQSVYWAGRYPVPTEEKYFHRLTELDEKYMWDSAPTANEGLRIRRRNANLTWTSFNELWSAAHASPALDALFDRDVDDLPSARPNRQGPSRRQAP